MEPQTTCRQCGTCCRKGGPSFHLEDRALIDAGLIQAGDLFTIRKGEPAHENVQGKILPVKTDIIKIKGKKGVWECTFLDGETNRCGIYANRPVECRTLTCWDTRKIEAIYNRTRLTRRDLLQNVAGLWDLVEDHQRRCDYDIIKGLAGKSNHPDKTSRRQLLEIVGFDTHIRILTTQQGGIQMAITEFLFGRPLTVTLPLMGIPIKTP
ncbi:MAG: YkgJ family cysteine cluster protein [Pseudomonadota bacterium]